MQRLEEMMKSEFPGTDIRQTPHINSKLQIWKKQHGSLSAMLRRSGVGFNINENFMIECEDEQWEQIVKVDAGAKPMRYKSWPMYDDWCEIFGNDRATGESAEDFVDAGNDMNSDNFAGEHGDPGQHTDKGGDFTQDVEAENSRCQDSSKEAVHKPAGNGKKRKQLDSVSVVANVISELGRTTSARLEEIANHIGYEFDIDQQRKDAYNSLDKIRPELSQEQKFQIAEIFVEKTGTMLLFNGLPPEAKPPYVHRLLNCRPK